jgi:ATP adenylyltransferase
MEYVSGESGSDECIFCSRLAESDDESTGILYRGPKTFVILNAYPYNTGHLMVAPNRHAGDITDLAPDERAEVMEVTSQSVAIVRDAMAPDGFNIGVNLGRVAGAGIPGHWHVHVVPRWEGDTNFMPVVAQTKVLPEMLADTGAKLRPHFSRL